MFLLKDYSYNRIGNRRISPEFPTPHTAYHSDTAYANGASTSFAWYNILRDRMMGTLNCDGAVEQTPIGRGIISTEASGTPSRWSQGDNTAPYTTADYSSTSTAVAAVMTVWPVLFGSNNIAAIQYYLGDTGLDSTSQFWQIGNGGLAYYDPWHPSATLLTKAQLQEMMANEGGITVGIYRSNNRQLLVVNGRVLRDGANTGGVTATALNIIETYGGSGTESKVAIIQGAAWHSSSGTGYFDGDFLLDVTKGPERLWAPRNIWLPVGDAGTNVTTNLRSLTLTEYSATITRDVNVLASTRSMTLTPYAATISVSGAVNVTTNLRSLTLTEYPATISVNREITTNLRSLTLTEYPATISVSTDTNVQTNLRSLTLTEYPATITRNVEVLANTRSLTLTEYPATIDTAGTVEVVTNLRSLTLTEYPATISVNREVLASVRSLVLTEYPASITINREVLAGTESMSLTTYPASIASGVAGKILKINGLYIYHP